MKYKNIFIASINARYWSGNNNDITYLVVDIYRTTGAGSYHNGKYKAVETYLFNSMEG